MVHGSKGVLFDFAGTLFRPADKGLVEGLRALGVPEEELAALGEQFRNAQRIMQGLEKEQSELAVRWSHRDLSGEDHRTAFLGVLQRAGVPAELARRWYERATRAELWQPYPDVAQTLETLHGMGIPVAVVSNIGWDPRPAFHRHGLHRLVSEFVLSYEVGIVKPDPSIFALACERLGIAPQDALMVGDNAESDGAAVEAGCRFLHVDHERVSRALLAGLQLDGHEHEAEGPPAPGADSTMVSELVEIWSAVLGLSVEADDDFFENGGTSLLAARIIARIRKQFGVRISLNVILRNPTPTAVAAVLAGELGSSRSGR